VALTPANRHPYLEPGHVPGFLLWLVMDQQLIDLVNELRHPDKNTVDAALKKGAKLLSSGSGMIDESHYNTIILALIAKIEQLESKITALESKAS
jgi:hypothetical protein